MIKRFISVLVAVFLLLTFGSVAATALTPTYTPTEAYKSSMFYERLSALELTGDQRRDILNVAFSQLGYHEGNSKLDFDGMNWNGTDNYTEFNYANRSTLDYGGSYAWCASFVTFCARQAGIPVSVIKNSVLCDSFVADFKAKSQYKTRASGYIPTAGDLIFFLSSGADRTYASHIGMVVGTDSSNVYTIEGNTSRGLVNLRSYALTNTYIVGYAVPAYTGVTGNYSDFPHSSGYVEPGCYKVTSETVNLRSEPSTSSGSVLKTLPLNTELVITEASGDWGKTTYNGQSGWISLKYAAPKDLSRYTITYNPNSGGTAPAQTVKPAGEAVRLSEEPATRSGYEFLGWARTPDADKAEFSPGDTYSENENLTLYAVWRKIKVKIEFLDDDGTVISSRLYDYGEEIEVPPDPKKVSDDSFDYIFDKWNKTLISTARADRCYIAVYTTLPVTGNETTAVSLTSEATARVMAEVDGSIEADTKTAGGCETVSVFVNAVSFIVLILGTGIVVLTVKSRI